ncbi:MAG: hypothetical protein J6J60_02405 [Clostridia bacterium]|nr:hypothetical protein [Clostridia bacterium]
MYILQYQESFLYKNLLIGNKYFIYDLDNVGLEISVEEADSTKLKLGQKAEVVFPSITEKFEGRVCYISKIPVEGMINAKIKLNYSDKIKFGCSAEVDVLLNEEIDSTVQEYDIRNSFRKIGKTKITVKQQEMPTGIEEMPMEFEEMMPESEDIENLPEESELDEGFDVDEISKYYSDMWEEYWNLYWKSYYEEYQTFEIIEPADKSDIPVKDVNKQEEIEGE